MEEGKGERYLASGRQYGNALLGVRHQEEEVSHSAPSLLMFPLEFLSEVNKEETRVMVLSCCKDLHDRSWSRFDTVPACDGQTDGRIYCS